MGGEVESCTEEGEGFEVMKLEMRKDKVQDEYLG